MTTEFAKTPLTKAGLRLAAAALLAAGLAACSTMESLDPTGLLGGDSTGGTSDTGGLSEAGSAAEQDAAQPDVASIPDRPQAPSTPEENAQVASSLQADAANAQYSADSLRGGTEAAAPAPGAAAPADTQVAALAPPPAKTPAEEPAPADVPADNITPGTEAASAAPEQAETTPSSDEPLTEAPPQPAAAPPPPPASADTSATAEVAPAPEPETESDQTAPEPAQTAEAPEQPEPAPSPDAAPAAEPAPPPTQVASAGPVPGAQAPVTRRAAPGFAPSHAPALDPSVSQFVAAPVVARYRQTAMLKPSALPAYTGSNMAYGPATATITFPGDTTILDDKGLQQVRAAAELFKAHGGQGFVRIVGYASDKSGNLSAARLMHVNFDHSQARATSIARALMKEGVPASKVLVDAAPQTAYVAKAEIFVQG